METKDGIKAIEADSIESWRKWLAHNYDKERSVWLIIYKKDSGIPSIIYPHAVDEALCFGWIDSKPNKRDDKSYYQFFAKRSLKSNWSKVNKEKVDRLLQEGRMAKPGLEMIELAKKTGTWDALNDVDALIIPEDLVLKLQSRPKALENFEDFPPSVRRGILEWIFNAKKEHTRMKRIEKTAQLAQQNIRANQFS